MSKFLSQCNACDKPFPADLPECPKCGNFVDISEGHVDARDWCFDIETFPNCFTCTWIHIETGLEVIHEISDRRNDWEAFTNFVHGLGRAGARGVGFNNLGFDYPVIHWIVSQPGCDVAAIYAYAISIIRNSNKFGVTIWDNDQIFKQLDLYKIWHFDNKAKSTSLKALEIVMRSRNVVDLPFPVGTMLDDTQKDILIDYNRHDVKETIKFYVRSLSEIQLREKLSEKYERNMLNFSNTKIGMTILVSQMEQSGLTCYERDENGRRQPRRTVREYVAFKDVIFPYVKFERPEFNAILNDFKSKRITPSEIEDEVKGRLKTKGVFKNMHCDVDGFTFVFGVGGIHGSIESQIVYSDDEYQIIDADVTSFYPRMAIVNKMYPSHLGESFCDIYDSIFNQRTTYAKGTPENAALKEALNASYGNSNNAFSPLFDPFYTIQTTVNGQTMLCMLAEQLMKIPDLTMIQANTDGLTYRCPREHIDRSYEICNWWQDVTKLELEFANYSRMMIRDVNNYIAEYESGDVKRKGAYEYKLQWHQDPSALVVPKAAEAALVRGESIVEFIRNHRDPFDFMCRAKVPRSNKLVQRWPEFDVEVELQGTTRVFISTNGGKLVKIAPPTGESGTWKRKAKVPDEMFNAVMRENAHISSDELDAMGGIPKSFNGHLMVVLDDEEYHFDSNGTLWDARIHTGNKSKHDTRELGMFSGWRVTECADAEKFDWSTLNYDWYIEQAEKLVKPLLNGGQ